jgi:WD40 repeat protein
MKTTLRRLLLSCLLAAAPGAVAQAQATFDFSGGTTFTGLVETIPIRANSPGGNSVGTISAIVFDPTSQVGGEYHRIYFTNREQTTGTAVGGLYVTNTVTKGVSFIGLQSNTANTNDNPSSIAIDSSGSVYVGSDLTSQVWRVDSPLSSPTFTRMLGNYGAATTDDDPTSLSWVPSTNQVMVFDQGLDTNPPVAITLVDAASTAAAPLFTTIWSTDPGADLNFKGQFSTFDNHAYFAYATFPLVSGTAAIYRVDLAGNLETIRLDGIDAALTLDDSVAVNPVDGSVWLPISTGGTNRTYYRVDVAGAALESPGVYLAPTTAEFTATGFNAGVNSTAFSPDGRWLAVAVPDGADTIYLLRTVVPEPATLALAGLALAGCAAVGRRRK